MTHIEACNNAAHEIWLKIDEMLEIVKRLIDYSSSYHA